MSENRSAGREARRSISVDRRNATFQEWETLLRNRTKRTRTASFLVQGVRPIDQAVRHGWSVQAWLFPSSGRRSDWASSVMAQAPATEYRVDPELLRELAEKQENTPELLAVLAMPDDDLGRIRRRSGPVLVFDRPSSPGNIGTMTRSVDALGGAGLIITGHAADPYDPKAVRAATGSLFATPVVRADSPRAVLEWWHSTPEAGPVLGTDEGGDLPLPEADLSSALIVIGNETRGMSSGWREAVDQTLSIPMTGSASSLNAANAATAVLYEYARSHLGR
ncbi:TrmH family RNA methyltransferase [Dermacoccaceae bacterium W4C1]